MHLAAVPFRLIDRPGEAMQEAARRRRSWWLPALLLVIGMLVLAWFSAPYQVELANEQSAQMVERITANMSDEQARMVRERSTEMTQTQFLITAAGTSLVLGALGWVLRGTVVHFTSLALGGASTWGSTFAVGVWSMIPFFVRDLVQTVYVMVNGQIIEHAGLSFMVASGDMAKDGQNPLYALLANTDPFALWHIVLLAVAIVAATRLSRIKATILAVVVWGLILALKLLPVVVGGALMGRFTG